MLSVTTASRCDAWFETSCHAVVMWLPWLSKFKTGVSYYRYVAKMKKYEFEVIILDYIVNIVECGLKIGYHCHQHAVKIKDDEFEVITPGDIDIVVLDYLSSYFTT